MSAAIVALPTAQLEPIVQVWKRCNKSWPKGVIDLAQERHARATWKRPRMTPEQAEAWAEGKAEAAQEKSLRELFRAQSACDSAVLEQALRRADPRTLRRCENALRAMLDLV